MNALARIGGLATRREDSLILLANCRETPPRAAKNRKPLACRWTRDPESGRLICIWGPDEGAQDVKPIGVFQLAA